MKGPEKNEEEIIVEDKKDHGNAATSNKS